MKRIYTFVVVFFMINSVFAQEFPDDPDEQREYVKENPSDPQSQSFIRDNPQVLVEDRDLARIFLSQNSEFLVQNPSVAEVWYSSPETVGVCKRCDDVFFSKAGNLYTNKEAALRYLQLYVARYGARSSIRFDVVEGLLFEAETGILRFGASSLGVQGLSSDVRGVLVEGAQLKIEFGDASAVLLNGAVVNKITKTGDRVEVEGEGLPPGVSLALNGGSVVIESDGALRVSKNVKLFTQNLDLLAEVDDSVFRIDAEGVHGVGAFSGTLTTSDGVSVKIKARGGASKLLYSGDFAIDDAYLFRGKRNPEGRLVVGQEFDGRFALENGIIRLRAYEGRQTMFHDVGTLTQVKTTGSELAVVTKGRLSDAFIEQHPNFVAFEKDEIVAGGSYDVRQGFFNSQSISSGSRINYALTEGIVRMEARGELRAAKGDPAQGDLIAWEGKSGSLLRLMPGPEGVEDVFIDGTSEGGLGRLSKGIVVDKRFYAVQDAIETTFVKENGRISASVSTANLQRLGQALSEGNSVVTQKYLRVSYGDAKIGVSPEGVFLHERGSQRLLIDSPGRVKNSFGERKPLVITLDEDQKYLSTVKDEMRALHEGGAFTIDPKTGMPTLPSNAPIEDKLALLNIDKKGLQAIVALIQERLSSAEKSGVDPVELKRLKAGFEFAVDQKGLESVSLIALDKSEHGDVGGAIAEYQKFVSENFGKPIAEAAIFASTRTMIDAGALKRKASLLDERVNELEQRLANLEEGLKQTTDPIVQSNLQRHIATVYSDLGRIASERESLRVQSEQQAMYYDRAGTYLELIKRTNPELSSAASLSLIDLHLRKGNPAGVIREFDSANVQNAPEEVKSVFFNARANAHFALGEVSEGMAYLHNAYSLNPQNAELKKDLIGKQILLLDAFGSVASKEHELINKKYNDILASYEGGIDFPPGTYAFVGGVPIPMRGLNYQIDPITALYTIGKGVGYSITGEVDPQLAAHDREVMRLHQEGDGMFTLRAVAQRSLGTANPLTMEDIRELQSTGKLVAKLEELYPTIEPTQIIAIQTRIENAFENPDVTRLASGASMGGFIQSYGNSDFLKEGFSNIGYDKSVSQNLWSVMEGVGQLRYVANAKNVAFLFGPAGTVYGKTAAQWIGRGAAAYVPGFESAANTLVAVKNSEAVVAGLQFSNTHLPTFTPVLSFVTEELAETALGHTAGYAASFIDERLYAPVDLVVSSLAGRAQIFDLGEANAKALLRNYQQDLARQLAHQAEIEYDDALAAVRQAGVTSKDEDEFVKSITDELNKLKPGSVLTGCAAGACLTDVSSACTEIAEKTVKQAEADVLRERARRTMEAPLAETVRSANDAFFTPAAIRSELKVFPSGDIASTVGKALKSPELPEVPAATRAAMEAGFEEVNPGAAFHHTLGLLKEEDPLPIFVSVLQNGKIRGGRIGTEFSRYPLTSANPTSISLVFDPKVKGRVLHPEGGIPGASPGLEDYHAYPGDADLDGLNEVLVRSADPAILKSVREQLDVHGFTHVKVTPLEVYQEVATPWKARYGDQAVAMRNSPYVNPANKAGAEELLEKTISGELTPKEARDRLHLLLKSEDSGKALVYQAVSPIISEVEEATLRKRLGRLKQLLQEDELPVESVVQEYRRVLVGESEDAVDKVVSAYLAPELKQHGLSTLSDANLGSDAANARSLIDNIGDDISGGMFTAQQQDAIRALAQRIKSEEIATAEEAMRSYGRIVASANDEQAADLQRILSPILESRGLLSRSDVAFVTRLDRVALAQELGIISGWESLASLSE